MPRPAVFLDRDGTINREASFLAHPDEVHLLPGVADALAALDAAGFALVVVTNQSGIARGLYGEAELARIHDDLHRRLGRRIDGWFHAPHHPDMAASPYGMPSEYRKPGSGLLHQAAEVLGLTFEGSWLVGDAARDLLAARGLPIRRILVRCGKPWQHELARLERNGAPPDAVVDDLAAAAAVILADRPERTGS